MDGHRREELPGRNAVRAAVVGRAVGAPVIPDRRPTPDLLLCAAKGLAVCLQVNRYVRQL